MSMGREKKACWFARSTSPSSTKRVAARENRRQGAVLIIREISDPARLVYGVAPRSIMRVRMFTITRLVPAALPPSAPTSSRPTHYTPPGWPTLRSMQEGREGEVMAEEKGMSSILFLPFGYCLFVLTRVEHPDT